MVLLRHPRVFIARTISVLLLVGAAPSSVLAAPGERLGEQYLCWPLEEALNDLRAHDLKVIYSSDLVQPDMQITTVPRGGSARSVLDQILAPFGLVAKDTPGDIVLVVRPQKIPAGGDRSRPGVPVGSEGLLPIWVDVHAGLLEWSFPVEPVPTIAAEARFLVVHLVLEGIDDWEAAAFALKNAIVDAKAEAPALRVGLEGPPGALEAIVSSGLAPYVDAYTHRGRRFVPHIDPTARSWWRTEVRKEAVLGRLLDGGAAGDELVILEGLALGPAHHAFLQQLQASGGALLVDQPAVHGIEADRVRFLLDPVEGGYFLAAYASQGGHEIRFGLPGIRAARSIFPKDAPFDFHRVGSRANLKLDGAYPSYLFELTAELGDVVSGGVDVESTGIVDPYEEVVRNQVFQDRELEKFQSLEVMEYITLTPMSSGDSQIKWEHRVIQRRGKLSEYHHRGYTRNGVWYPQAKLRKGRIFRNEALVQLNPLEIELDETYRYDYLGAEIVDGRPTYKIRFEPLRESTVEDGSLVAGVVWLDQESSAHRRMKIFQRGLDGLLISQETTTRYEWIPGEGHCFWDWRERDGNQVISWLGEQHTDRYQTERVDFAYNQPDIDEIAQAAYDSDVLIHVETPPEGHRWLVKVDGKRTLAKLESGRFERYFANGREREEKGPAEGSEAGAEESGRALADIHSYSRHARLSLGGYGSGDSVDLYPGIVFTDRDFLTRGVQAYLGFFLEDAVLSLSYPNVFGRAWTLTTSVFYPYDSIANGEYDDDPEAGVRNFSVETHEGRFSLGAGIPVNRFLSVNTVYSLRNLRFSATEGTDPAFTLPSDTLEHVLDLAFNLRWSRYIAQLGIEYGWRADWEPWGLEETEPLLDSYQVLTASIGAVWHLPREQTLGATFGYLQGWDLDRFSRVPNGLGRARQVGFDRGSGFDQALTTSLDFGTSLFRKVPIVLRLDGGHGLLREGDDESENRVGMSLQFRLNGPFQTDIWPSVRYAAYSSVPGEEGRVTYGLTISWRQ